jgi:hypothetical protein
VGFEPTDRLLDRLISSQEPSTTQPPFRLIESGKIVRKTEIGNVERIADGRGGGVVRTSVTLLGQDIDNALVGRRRKKRRHAPEALPFRPLSAMTAFSGFAPSFETSEASSLAKVSEDTSSDRSALFPETVDDSWPHLRHTWNAERDCGIPRVFVLG